MILKDLLLRVGLKKAQLARDLGLNPNTVSDWKDKPPRYAIAYLELLIAFNNANKIQRIIDEYNKK